MPFMTLKPTFHQRPFVVGPRDSLYPNCINFALPIPTCWYLNSLTDQTQSPVHETLRTQREPQYELVEYGSPWVCKG